MSHNLELQGGTFHVRLAVPKDVQKAFDGRKILSRSLGTGSRKEAMERRLPILHTWKAQIKAARSGNPLPQDWQDSFAASLEAVDTVTKWSKAARIGVDIPLPARIPSHAEMQEFMNENEGFVRVMKGLVQKASQVPMGQFKLSDEIGEVFKSAVAQRYETRYTPTPEERDEIKAIAAGGGMRKPRSPITTARLKTFREFRESRGGAPKHIDQQVGKMERLSEFLKKDDLALNFDTVDSWLKSLDRAPATLSQYLMAGTAFWKWAMKYDAGWRDQFKDKVNPFVGHDLPQGGGAETAGKDREIYTKADTLKLQRAALDNDDQPLADLIALGWYTGARIEELCRLTKDSVITVDGVQCFDFPRSKSKASKRVVPIHPSLLSTVDRLVKDSTDTFLIPAESADKYGKRSHAISKAFGRLRTAAGFSRLHVFHSFRHTVVTELIRADVPDALAKELVGHETGSVTHDVYSKGASAAQKLAAISRLPALTPQDG
ncbi:site-specific integrase [Pseudomonas sp. SH10-3B]|uniref:tyrosine-type recombinase/integrase n=1 Tax=Pseudomonas sp. SH10-3B TaxID=2816049 RepID=UPI001CA6D331|nr:site-specific integrase [Pseudomonas sp. SH10-3B]